MSLLPLSPELNDLLAGYGLGTGGLADILGRDEPMPLGGPPPPAASRGFGGMNRGQWGEFLGGFGDMLTGYPLAERMMKRRVQAEQIRRQRILDELALQRERRLAEQEQRQAEHQDIATRMALGEAGYRPLEPGEEPQEPVGRYQIGATGPPVQINKRPVEEYGGRRYVGPSPFERRREAAIAKEIADAEKVRDKLLGLQPHYETDAAGNVTAIYATGQTKKYPKTGKAAEPKNVTMHYETDAAGNVRQIAPTGEIKNLGKIGKPAAAAGGEGTVAAERLRLAQRKAREDELVALEKREDAVAKQVSDLRSVIGNEETDEETKKAAANRLTFKEAQLRRIRQQKLERGFTTREDLGLAPPKKTAAQQTAGPKKSATLAQLKAFAAAKGISEAEARKRFAAEGYEVK